MPCGSSPGARAPPEFACSSPQKQPEQSLPLPRVLCLNAASLLGANVESVSNALEVEVSPPVCEALHVHTHFLVQAFNNGLSKVIKDIKYLWRFIANKSLSRQDTLLTTSNHQRSHSIFPKTKKTYFIAHWHCSGEGYKVQTCLPAFQHPPVTYIPNMPKHCLFSKLPFCSAVSAADPILMCPDLLLQVFRASPLPLSEGDTFLAV